MDESKFWQIIEQAWDGDAELQAFRRAVLSTLESESAKGKFDEENEGDPMIPGEDKFIAAVEELLDALSQDELKNFDRILERKLFDIDREDIHEFTDGSDDGFLYCRGFIVALGREYYEAIDKTPSKAMYDWECEAMTYVSHHIYTKKFGEMPSSEISRETCSNRDAWPNL